MSAGAPEPPPRLDPKNLFDRRMKRDHARLKAYNQLLATIHQRIFTTSQMSGNANFITYTIPPFIFGLPKLDLQDCVVYLVYMLRQSGYEVRFTYPNLLYISWRHHERDYLMTQNPIVQAMLPAEIKRDQKKKDKQARSVSFAPDPRRPPSEAQAAPARRTIDYEPPTSFLNSVQKPLPENKPNVLSDLWKFS
jgi:hypothetical protein